jgi:hypothetical protein
MTKKQQKEPAQLTVTELMKTEGVPVWVRLWLERLVADNYALEPNGLHDDPATREVVRLVYDVLDTDRPYATDTSDHSFPGEARDFVEAWMYRMTEGDYLVQPWGNPDMAAIALPIALDNTGGPLIEYEKDATLSLLRTAIKSLTTKEERRAFLRDTEESDAEPEKESATNLRAAFKLSRVLADPRTPAETSNKIEDELIEFSSVTRVYMTHPALVRRAFLLMCEARPKGRARDCRRTRRRLLALLDSIPEGKGGDK